jgi:hypothetical protein
LQLVDKDGGFTYSRTIAVVLKARNSQLTVFPSPVKTTLYVQLSSAKEEQLSVQIIDMIGSVLQQQGLKVSVGSTSLSFNASMLARGNYVLVVKSENGMQQKKFIKE